MTQDTILSKTYVKKDDFVKIVATIVSQLDFTYDQTQEIMLLKDKVNWMRSFWNPVSQLWQTAMHTPCGWEALKTLNNAELTSIVESLNTVDCRALQYKTQIGVHFYIAEELR